jgi:dienelactone hydrolase
VLLLDETTEMGVTERRFDLEVGGEKVPGIHWLPESADGPHPTVLIGHGGTQNKRAPNILGLARKLVRANGFGVVALDAPAHGDRQTEEQRRELEEMVQSREGTIGQRIRRLMDASDQAVAEWKALLDQLQLEPAWTAGPFGYWGLSMGTLFGVPLLAGESRISAAVLGLGALRKGDTAQQAQAGAITVPVLFLCQSEDELMTRDGAVALWDALGSRDKSLHINPGRHVEVPMVERDAAVEFFRRHLSTVAA